jgi:hypothetical protein
MKYWSHDARSLGMAPDCRGGAPLDAREVVVEAAAVQHLIAADAERRYSALMHRFRSFRAWLALGACASVVVSALALAGTDDRASALATLAGVETSPHREAAQDFVTRARASLDRASRLRTAGDEPRAKLSERAALRWAEAARDIAQAVSTEEHTADLARRAADAGQIADRERALLEEAAAQQGRLRALLDSDASAPLAKHRVNSLDGGSP